jgi:LuxR family maltose regulon positive regulatory protein
VTEGSKKTAVRNRSPAVLAATLMPPAVPTDALARPRLEALLDQALDCDLAVVTAPPGSGKTVMVAQWLASRPDMVACWLSIGSEDNRPARFWHHLLRAIDRVAPDASRAALKRVDRRDEFGAETLIVFLNDLAELDHDLVIVLDDLHELTDPLTLESLTFLVEHLPPRVHVVTCGREDPALPLHRLRVSGQLLEIGEPLLRFDRGEVDEYLGTRGYPDDTERRVVEDRTEGWVAGVRLASLYPAGSARRSELGPDVAAEAAEYLRRELVLHQSDDVRAFLAVISVLDEFCASLCNAVTGRGDADEVLRSLVRCNLFLVPTREDGWYRFHHLFRDLLRTLQPSDTAEIHLAAGQWCENDGRFGLAIDDYLAADDLEQAHRLLDQQASSPAGWREPDAVRAWLDAMPADFLAGDSDHLVRTAAILLWSGDFQNARRWLELAQARVNEQLDGTGDDPRLAAAWCWYHESRGDALEAVAAGRRAIQLAHGQLDGDAVLAQVPALLVRANGALENFGAARAAFARLPSMVHISEVRRGAMARGALAWVAFQEGQLRGALDLAESALALDDADALTAGFARLARGAVLAERAEHAAADVDLRAAADIAERLHHPVLGALVQGQLALLSWRAGRPEHALELVVNSRRVRPPYTLPARVSAGLRLIQAHVLLALDDVDGAARLGLAQTGTPQHLWRARVALAEGDHTSALDQLRAADTGASTLRQLLETAVLRARVLLDAGREEGPTALAAAAALAEPEGFVELFLSEGDDFISAVRRVVALEPSPYLYLLLSLYEDRRERPAPELPAVVEPMSGRERIVLRYLQGRLSNVEIARELSISTNTLKTHLKSIYRKLGAASRAEAIAQARRLQLL